MNVLGSFPKVIKTIFYFGTNAIALGRKVKSALFSTLLVLAVLGTGTPTVKDGPSCIESDCVAVIPVVISHIDGASSVGLALILARIEIIKNAQYRLNSS